MSDHINDDGLDIREQDLVLDPSNLEAERHQVAQRLSELLDSGDDDQLARTAGELSPGDLSEILRPFSVADTVRVLRQLDADLLADVLSEIDNRSTSAFFTLLDHDEIADILEEMPSDEATDVIAEMDEESQQAVLEAMEEEEREEVAELLRYPPESAGGIMGKEVVTCHDEQNCGEAVAGLRESDQDELEDMHFVYVLDDREHLVGRVPLFKLLLMAPETPIAEAMEPEPLYVEVDLDQEDVAQFMKIHDLISLPVVDHRHRLVGQITADDVLEVLEEEATEDMAHMAGVSVKEFGEQSPLRVARSRLPWLLGGLAGQIGAILVLQRFEASIASMVTLAFFIPVIMAMAGNVGIQTSSVVVRGLATGEVDYYHLGRHLLRELVTSLLVGFVVGLCLYLICGVVVGDMSLALVLALSMLLVIIFAATVGTGIPLLLHRLGADPAVATGPFITTANDIFGLLIYLGLATLFLQLGAGGPA